MLSLVLDPIFQISLITVATLVYVAVIPDCASDRERRP
jgi:hypothetical protein